MDIQTKGEKTRARVLKEARKLIIANGFKNTSINEIIDATGVKKGALYFHFANKDELGFSILLNAKDEFFQFLTQSFHGKNAYERIDNFFTALLEQQKDINFVGGCLFGNTALEMSDTNERFAGVIHDVFSEWVALLAKHLQEAKEAGRISKGIDPELFAKTIVASLEGGIMMARVSKDVSDLEDCMNVLRTMMKP